MDKLKIEHLAPYLPHGLRVAYVSPYKKGEFKERVLCAGSMDFCLHSQDKPILRPLSDLTKEIEVDGEKFIPLYRLQNIDRGFVLSDFDVYGYENLKYSVMEKLFEWHFDALGLIPAGLAMDENTFNK